MSVPVICYVSLFFLTAAGLANCDQQQAENHTKESEEYQPFIYPITDEIDFQDAMTADMGFFVMFYIPWCDFCEQLKPVFNELALQFNLDSDSEYYLEYPLISEIDCSKMSALCDRFNVDSYPTLLMFNEGIDSPKRYDGPHSFEHLVNYTMQHRKRRPKRYPIELSRKTFEEMDSSDLQFVMFYSPTCAFCKAVFPDWKNLAEAVNKIFEGVVISQVNCEVERDLCVDQGVVGFPTFVLYMHGKMLDKYEGRNDPEAFIDYLTSMKNELSKQVNTFVETKSNSEAIILLNDKNIDEFLKSGYFFINFYKPWCSFCQALQPIWSQLILKYKNSAVGILSIDCTVQYTICNKYDIAGYPTMLMFFKGRRQAMYTGVHEFEALSQFVAHQTNQKEL